MKWSWRLITVAGIGIYVHATFFLLLIWAAWASFAVRREWSDVFEGVAFIMTLFGIVVLHELGHAKTAKRFGIGTRDITLLPIGGVARLERMPEEPKQELAVALAGPAVNVLLALLFYAIFGITRQFTWNHELALFGGTWLSNLIVINVWLACFNLLPAFPMDGGRVLRALLATRLTYVRATGIAASIGQGMAFLFGLVGVIGLPGLFGPNPVLVLIAVFVWFGAAQEANFVQMKSALSGTTVRDIMIREFRTLAPEDTLERAVEYLLAGYQQDFPVASDGRVEGLLTRSALVNGLAKLGASMPVADAMEQEFATARPEETAESVFQRLQAGGDRSVLVLAEGRLVGILTRENLGEFLMVESALNARPR